MGAPAATSEGSAQPTDVTRSAVASFVAVEDQRYEILDVIGSGGMATVWRARDLRLGRMVAIKRPNATLRGAVDTARFAREARVAAAVTHPHVVAVYDVGVDDDGAYLVMELVDGPSLRDATVPADQVAEIGAQVASALAALHAAGVVHGDVKPANILLASGGAKLTDFGIARAVDDTMTLTVPGMTFATPAYAAPETLAHGERSPGADVYSLAAVIHELLTGARWNAGLGSTQPMPAHAWARVLKPALSTTPADRPTAADFADSLTAVDAEAESTPTTPIQVAAVPAATTIAAAAEPDPLAQDDEPERTGRVAMLLFVGALALIAAIVFATRAIDDASADSPDSSAGATSHAAPTATNATPTSTASTPAPPTTAPPTEPSTTAPATAPPTTPAPTTTPTTQPPERTTVDVVDDLVAIIDAVPKNKLKSKDARRLVDRIDRIVADAAERPTDTEDELGEVAEWIAAIVDDDAHADAGDLLVELADRLGLDTSIVDAWFGSTG